MQNHIESDRAVAERRLAAAKEWQLRATAATGSIIVAGVALSLLGFMRVWLMVGMLLLAGVCALGFVVGEAAKTWYHTRLAQLSMAERNERASSAESE